MFIKKLHHTLTRDGVIKYLSKNAKYRLMSIAEIEYSNIGKTTFIHDEERVAANTVCSKDEVSPVDKRKEYYVYLVYTDEYLYLLRRLKQISDSEETTELKYLLNRYIYK